MSDILKPVKRPSVWGESDNFEMQGSVISSPKDNEEPFIDTVVGSLKQTKDLVVNESKTLAPTVVSTFKQSSARMDGENRIFSPIPNSILYYSIMVIGLIFIAKKL